MPSVDIVDLNNATVGSIELADAVFGAEVNEALVYEAVRQYTAARRSGTAATKTRHEVSGSGKKLWKQKGTGRARMGSIRSPLWRHGGTVHGPQPRSYEYKLPRQIKKAALRAALSLRASEQKIIVLDAFGTDGKTKSVASALATLGPSKKVLIVDAKTNEQLVRGARNLPTSQWLAPEGLNVYDILRHDTLILTQDAAKSVTDALKGKE